MAELKAKLQKEAAESMMKIRRSSEQLGDDKDNKKKKEKKDKEKKVLSVAYHSQNQCFGFLMLG